MQPHSLLVVRVGGGVVSVSGAVMLSFLPSLVGPFWTVVIVVSAGAAGLIGLVAVVAPQRVVKIAAHIWANRPRLGQAVTALVLVGLGILLGIAINRPVEEQSATPSVTAAPAASPISAVDLEQLRSSLTRAQGEANNWRNDNATLRRQLEESRGIANDTEDQAVARQAMYRFYDRSFQPAVASLREFTVLLDTPLGPLPQPREGQFRHQWMVSGLLSYAVVRWDFEPHWERLSGDQDPNNRERNPIPFTELETRMQAAFCAYERLAYWTQYSALGWSGFDRNGFEPYQRWNSRDQALVGAIADVTSTPGLDRFTARWESCRGPEQWQTQRFRIRDLSETTNR